MTKILEDFDSKYERIHKELQENSRLVREIYSLERKKSLGNDETERVYFPCGSFEFEKKTIHIRLSLDWFHNHIVFPQILANMRLIYEVSNGKADLSKVYAQLDDKLGIVSEDVSCGGRYPVEDDVFFEELDKSLLEIFIFKGNEKELEESTSLVRDNKGNKIRCPIIDLDDLGSSYYFKSNIKPKWRKKYYKYRKQYQSDDRFRIHEKI